MLSVSSLKLGVQSILLQIVTFISQSFPVTWEAVPRLGFDLFCSDQPKVYLKSSHHIFISYPEVTKGWERLKIIDCSVGTRSVLNLLTKSIHFISLYCAAKTEFRSLLSCCAEFTKLVKQSETEGRSLYRCQWLVRMPLQQGRRE